MEKSTEPQPCTQWFVFFKDQLLLKKGYTDGQIVSGKSKNSGGNTNEKSSTTSNATKSSTASTKSTEKININSATQTELETLPGIGSSTALKIINYRKENGKFKTIEEIKNVKGIGDAKYEKIKELIKV